MYKWKCHQFSKTVVSKVFFMRQIAVYLLSQKEVFIRQSICHLDRLRKSVYETLYCSYEIRTIGL